MSRALFIDCKVEYEEGNRELPRDALFINCLTIDVCLDHEYEIGSPFL